MTPVKSDAAPAAIGPYSQAVVHEGLCWASGQVGLDPASGNLVGADVAMQARQALANLRAVLAAAGTDLQHVLRATVYLRDMADFATVNHEYATAFGEWRPARATVAVAGLPRDARVEIDCVAAIPSR
jgi:2-iminobutanoate/2-iminopropanoate deaminase